MLKGTSVLREGAMPISRQFLLGSHRLNAKLLGFFVCLVFVMLTIEVQYDAVDIQIFGGRMTILSF